MKRKPRALIALMMIAALLCGLLTGCGGGKQIEPGDYSGSVRISHTEEISVPAMGGGQPGTESFDQWGADVTITVDEDGVIWNIVTSEPEGYKLYPSAMVWTVFGGKFTGSITGNYTCQQIMDITVDVGEDGFPVLNGDCSGIHQPEGMNMTLLNDNEVACALILLAMQDAITANGLV